MIVTVTATLAALPAAAQRYDGERDERSGARNLPGEFDYYTLVLSWSPTYCASIETDDRDPQCNRRDGRRFAFVLHGLWPQYEKGWPEFCRTRRKPFVPHDLIDGMLDIMPSPRLVIHEYRKHGTCSGLAPAGYYALSRRLFQEINIPRRYINPFETQFVSPEDLTDELLAINPGLTPDMIAITCGGPGNRLREVRVCFDRAGKPRACSAANENQRRLCSANRMFVPPVRNTAPPGSNDRQPPDRRTETAPASRASGRS
jgi:ribonuclease T2